MDLYTLTSGFMRRNVIDRFSSVIWTERYNAPGDVTLTVDPTPEMINELAEGTCLASEGTDEVMLIETQSIGDNGQLVLTGNSLLGFLNQRALFSSVAYPERSYPLSGFSAGYTLALIVNNMVIDPLDIGQIGDEKNIIANLTLGTYDTTGPSIDVNLPFGPLLDVIKPVAETYAIGMSLYLESADESGYSLKFTTYKGIDRTSDQDVNEIVRFSPVLDSLTAITELRSIAGYKNIAYAFHPGFPDMSPVGPRIVYADIYADTTRDFDRRILMVTADNITKEMIIDTPALVIAILNQVALDALANNNYVRVIDGEVVPQDNLEYGIHYMLGDVVELQGHSGLVQKARITEYIRSQDASGERAYPTVSVVTENDLDTWYGETFETD